MLPESYVPIVDFLEEMYRPLNRERITVHEPWRSVLTAAFTPDPETGKLPYTTVILSAPKKCLVAGERMWLADGRFVPCETLLGQSTRVWAYDEPNQRYVPADATVWDAGEDEVVELELICGRVIRRSVGHKVLASQGWTPAGDLRVGECVAIPDVPEPEVAGAVLSMDSALALGAQRHLVAIPDDVWRSPNRIVAQFLRGAMADGPYLRSASLGWARDAQAILSRFGVVAEIWGGEDDYRIGDEGDGLPAALRERSEPRSVAGQPFAWDRIAAVRRLGRQRIIAVTVPEWGNHLAHEVTANSGKSLYAGGVAAWFATCMSPPGDEILLVANKREQVVARVFKDLCLAREHHPMLRKSWKQQAKRIDTANGTSIVAISTEAGGEAGANPGLIVHDEMWDWGPGADERLFAELSPVPTKLNSVRLIVTYAGYSATSTVLWREYQAAMQCPPHPDFLHLVDDQGEPVVRASRERKTLCYWEHVPRMPWQTDADGQAYYEDQERKCLPSEFLRLHRNRWTTGEEGIDMRWWDACVDPNYVAPQSMPSIYLALGADASFKKDLTAVMSVYKKKGLFYLGPCKWWQPDPKKEDFDIERTAGDFIRGLKGRYRIRCGNYDSYQFASCALNLKREGFRIEEFTQSQPNGKKMGNKLIDVLREKRIVLPADDFLRQQAASVTLKLSSDGVQLTKDRARNKKIDCITALSMALLAAEKLPDADKSVGASVMVLA